MKMKNGARITYAASKLYNTKTKTMRTEKQVLELRGEVHAQMQEILSRAHKEKRALLPDEEDQWQKANADYNLLSKEIDMIRAMAGYTEPAESEPKVIPITQSDGKDDKRKAYEAYFKNLFYGSATLTREEALRLAHSDGPTRAQTSTGGTGAYVIPEEFIRMLEVTMKSFSGMLQASYLHRSQRAGTMNWPTIDDTAQTGAWQDEPRNSGLTPRAFTFGRVQYSAYTWADMAQLTWEFIQDEDVDFVSRRLAELFGSAAGRAINQALTDGDGSGKPTGIIAASGGASTGKTTASASAITKAELIDVQHSVDPAYRTGPNVAWMMNDSVLAYIRKLDFGSTDTVPLWQPSFQAGEPDRILGYPYVINQSFPSITNSAKVAVFGDWSKYVVRQVKDFEMVRLNERFADQLSTGFLGWLRIDGKILNTAALKVLRMLA